MIPAVGQLEGWYNHYMLHRAFSEPSDGRAVGLRAEHDLRLR